MTDKHPIYPNADAREADRLREEKLAADLRGRVKELEAALKRALNYAKNVANSEGVYFDDDNDLPAIRAALKGEK